MMNLCVYVYKLVGVSYAGVCECARADAYTCVRVRVWS